MRTFRVATCFLIIGLILPLSARIDRAAPSVVAVILDFKGPHSRTSVAEMEHEASRIIGASGIALDWRIRGEDAQGFYARLVTVTFRGACQDEPQPWLTGESGPLAVTRSTDGEILPFGEVDCGRVVNVVRGAMSDVDFARANLLIGRAMGRVVAHELVHMLTKSAEHDGEGVEKSSLSGMELIEGTLRLSPLDIDRLRQHRDR